jgi:predicted ATP-grasp superfamily ATP-dependent carboligase
MPSVSRVRSPEAGAAILIAASSGRVLAAAARRAGFRPLAADFFDDLDTRGFCAANRLVEGGLHRGFDEDNLIPALDALAEDEAPCGFVYGAGFEDRPELLEIAARRFTLIGNPPDVVRRVKAPARLSELCAALNIPHPKISVELPADSRHWLVKSVGGAGGSHIAPVGAIRATGENIYFQRIVEGEAVSILFVADGAKAQVVGLSRQWAAPAPGEPFRFGGSVCPAGLPPGLEDQLRRAAKAVTAACGLRGLNSIDFLVAGGGYTLIEINPRPGATLDIFNDRDGALFRAHVESCLGRLPAHLPEFSGAAAAAIAYAPRDISRMPDFDWPDWTADRQKPRSEVRAQDPLCTINARAAEPSTARAILDERANWILGRLEQVPNKANIGQNQTNIGKETAH